MEGTEGAEFVLDDDCLGHIVACTSSGSTLFALAQVCPTLERLVLARLEAPNAVFVPALSIYSHRKILEEPLRAIGATVLNQYIIYDKCVHWFTHDNNESAWRRLLSRLPPIKRIYLLCCCHSGIKKSWMDIEITAAFGWRELRELRKSA